MTNEDAIKKTAESVNSDLLHYLKELARIEKKYRPKIIALTERYWDDIDELNRNIDRTIGGNRGNF